MPFPSKRDSCAVTIRRARSFIDSAGARVVSTIRPFRRRTGVWKGNHVRAGRLSPLWVGSAGWRMGVVALAPVSVMHLSRFGELRGKPGRLVGTRLMLAALFVSPLCALSSALFSGLIMWVPASIPYCVGALPLVGRRLTGAATAGRTS